MTDLDALELFTPTPATPRGVTTVRCRHPRFAREIVQVENGGLASRCSRCGTFIDPASARRGKLNRARGNAIEREVAAQLGLRRVGQYGSPEDVAGDLFVGQVKSGAAFPERLWSWLRAVSVTAGQTAILVVTDAPGPGHRRRALVVLELGDWIALHGERP